MNRFNLPKTRIRALLAVVIVAAVICGLRPVLWSAEQMTDSRNSTASDTNKTNTVAAAPAKKAAKKFTGAELYAIHCNRCHAERYATERTDAAWKTIMLHMQTRAQLPVKDAKAILKYLQEEN